MDYRAPKLSLHLSPGQCVRVEATQVLLGRGHHLPDDPELSRQHALIGFNPATGVSTVVWMGRQTGWLSGPHPGVEMIRGMQRELRDGSVRLPPGGAHATAALL